MGLNPFHKLIITAFVSIVFIGILAWFLGTASSDVLNSVDILSSIESRIATLEFDRRTALAVAEVIRKHSSDFERIGKFLIDRERPVEFIEALENLANSTDNEIAIDVVAAERGASKDTLSFRLTIEGSSASVFRYLRLLELMPYHISAEDFNYQTLNLAPAVGGKSKSSSQMRLAILIKVKTKT